MDLGDIERIDDLEMRLMALEQRNKELNIELMRKSAEASEAREEAIRLNTRAENLLDQMRITTVDRPYDETEEFLIRANEEARRLLMLIKIHRMQTGHNLCWMNDLVLWRQALNDSIIEYPHDTIPREEEFEAGCESWCKPYYRSRHKCQNQLPVSKPPSLPGYETSK